jgi:LCP family protein required for cell wall assembly
VPGLGLIHGKHRRGWIILLGFLAVILAAAVWVIWRGPVRALSRLAGDPVVLYTIAVALALAIVIWAITILRSYRVLRGGRRITRVQRGLGWGLVASLILCVGVPLGVGSAYSKVQADTIRSVFGESGGSVQDKAALWANQPRINVFLIGRDNGDGREGTRPDTMLVASIDTRSGDTTLISVPRNLNYAHFPEGTPLAERFPDGFDGFGPDESLINAVWTWAEQNPEAVGETEEGLEVGMYATMQAVEGSLGLELDYHSSVDMEGFEDVVDAIGGVKIDVERPIPMGGGTNMNTGLKNPIKGWIDPGEQVLQGKKALWYVRSRDGADNYDRMCRQQRMLKTTLDQVNPQELAAAYPKLAGSAERNIQTDIAQNAVPAFVELAIAMQGGEIKSAQITNDVVSTSNPDYDVLHEWVQEQINPAEPSQAEEAAPAEEETEAPEEEPTPEETPEHKDGIEDADGKCYPRGYEPGSGWPGYPGPEGDQG